MLTEERKQWIMKELIAKHSVKTSTLARQLKTSISTIRRDLQELEAEQRLKRVHGGALLPNVQEEMQFSKKLALQQVEKQGIAKYAASLIQEGEVIFLDAGSTTQAMIPYLEQKKITVVTNAISHVPNLVQAQVPTYIIGGLVKPTTQAVINTTALQQLATLRFDRAFMGTNAIHPVAGFETPDIEEANLKQMAIQHSKQAYVLADYTKFEASAFTNFAPLEAATIITDTVPTPNKEQCKTKTKLEEITL